MPRAFDSINLLPQLISSLSRWLLSITGTRSRRTWGQFLTDRG
jgi:hypothetical protein